MSKNRTGLPQLWSVIAICLSALFLFHSCLSRAVSEPTMASISDELGITIDGGNDFIVEKNLQRDLGSRGLWNIEARRGSQTIKIEVVRRVDDASALAYIQERQSVLRSLFHNMPSPYPGVISKEVSFPTQYAPKVVSLKIDGQPADVYILPSTSRMAYGAKDEDAIRYRGGVIFVYNRTAGDVFRMDLFIPKEEYKEADVLGLFSSLRFHGVNKQREIASEGSTSPGAEDITPEGKSFRSNPTNTDGGGPNLIIVGFEPLGARHVSSYGYPRETTPNLDKFASGAALFRNAVSPSSWTLPAFMSWMTSLYPSQHTLTNKYRLSTMKGSENPDLSSLPAGIITLAQYLGSKGLITAGFTGGAALSGDFGYGRGFDEYFDKATFGGFELTMPLAVKWLRANAGKRFFLFVQGFDVHGRYPVTKDAEGRFMPNNYTGKFSGSVEEYWKLRDENLDNPDFAISVEDVSFWKANYDAKIYEADRKFGEFMKEISELGLLKNTVIIVSSGSGNEYFEHGGIDHGLTLYDELVLVPLIIKSPGIPGRVIEEQVRTLDIMPTALDLLGISINDRIQAQMEGVSLLPGMKGDSLHLDAYMETDYLAQSFKRAIRTSDGYKFIYAIESGEREFYDLSRDPEETKNMISYAGTTSYRLEQKLISHLNRLKANSF